MKKTIFWVLGIISAVFFTAHSVVAADLYVSKAIGVNKNEGTKQAPLKNIHAALRKAEPGDKIHVAEGNYLGLLDRGYIEITKSVEIYGGYSSDFSQRNIFTYRTEVMPPSTTNGTARNKALMEINLPQKEETALIIDGFVFDKGNSNGYHETEGKIEGIASGNLTFPPSKGQEDVMTNRAPLLRAAIQHGSIIIRNCVFNNASFQGILIGIDEANVLITNNVFTANTIGAAEIYERIPSSKPASFEFSYNTVLFNWKEMAKANDQTSYGFGVRSIPDIKSHIHHNIIGLSSMAAIGFSNAIKKDNPQDITIDNNIFFHNQKGDLLVRYKKNESTVFSLEQFDQVGNSIKLSKNTRLQKKNPLEKVINKAYMDGFLSNQTLFANRYPVKDTLNLFGAVKGFGAQFTDDIKK